MIFGSWREARDYAERRVKETRIPHGIEKASGGLFTPGSFRVFMLPRKANRTGHELRCEAVEPE